MTFSFATLKILKISKPVGTYPSFLTAHIYSLIKLAYTVDLVLE